MKISSEIIQNYEKDLADSKYSIHEEMLDKASILASRIAFQVGNILEEEKTTNKAHIVLPSDEDIKNKISNNLESYFLEAVEAIITFINRQQSAILYCVSGDEETAEIKVDDLLYQIQNNNQLLSQEEIILSDHYIPKVIDQVITHINFRNMNNDQYRNYEPKIEISIKNKISELFEQSKEKLRETFSIYQNLLLQRSYHFGSYIFDQNQVTNQKSENASSLENLLDHPSLDELTEKKKDELIYGVAEEPSKNIKK